MFQDVSLILPLIGLALLLGASVYESVVMAPNYERDIPNSLNLARQFLVRTTPAHYFRIISPVTLLLLLAGLWGAWPVPSAQWAMLAAVLALATTDVITFTFHYPRLKIMFRSDSSTEPSTLRLAARGWAVGNYVRIMLLIVAFLCVLAAVISISQRVG